MTGDDVREHRTFQHQTSLVERCLPKGLAEFGQRVPAPDIINQNVETALLIPDTLEEHLNFGLNGMVGLGVYTDTTARRAHLRCLFDRLRPIISRRFSSDAAPSAVDCRSGFAKRAGNASAGA